MDAFYASIEQRDHPELRGRPVMVGGSSPRGVVAAASYEARTFGVHSAMPRESKRIFEVFRRFTPVVQGLSLDEAFLDLTGTSRLHGPPAAVGRKLREAVREETGLPVSVGIAPVKMVAKIASDAAKPDGMLEVVPGSLRAFLDPLPVRRIWGVGPVAEERLLRCGYQTLGDLARAEPAQLRRQLGPWGAEIGRLARGEDVREVEARTCARWSPIARPSR
jgi:DNA polymerase-4